MAGMFVAAMRLATLVFTSLVATLVVTLLVATMRLATLVVTSLVATVLVTLLVATMRLATLVVTSLGATRLADVGEGLAWLVMPRQDLGAKEVGQQAEGREVTKEEQEFNGALLVLVAVWVEEGLAQGGRRHPPWRQ